MSTSWLLLSLLSPRVGVLPPLPPPVPRSILQAEGGLQSAPWSYTFEYRGLLAMLLVLERKVYVV